MSTIIPLGTKSIMYPHRKEEKGVGCKGNIRIQTQRCHLRSNIQAVTGFRKMRAYPPQVKNRIPRSMFITSHNQIPKD